jgi:glycosyltransferase involved in cell wall biosynthesis
MHTDYPFVSIIVPVYNDAERLKICLEALQTQTYPETCYEVIVIDNASDNDIKHEFRRYKNIQIEIEPRKGSYAARNKGISLAKGDYLAGLKKVSPPFCIHQTAASSEDK